MPHRRTCLLLAAATFVGGILAGGIIDRVFVGGPAWRTFGAEAWAQFSRHADLGSGLLAYPVEGIGGAALIIAAALSNYLDGNTRQVAPIPLYFAVAFSVTGLILTVKAAPIMLALGAPAPAIEPQRAFDEFFLWGLYLRGAADTLAFLAEICALSSLGRAGRPVATEGTPS